MKYLHILIGTSLLIYTILNILKFGIGEILVCSTFFPTLIIAWFAFKKDLTGMMLAGMLIGIAIEYLTEIYWVYSMKVYIWRDVSLFVIMGWGYNFTFYILLSGVLSRLLFKSKNAFAADPKFIPMDMICGPVWFLSNELWGMKGLHLWNYSKYAGWTHTIPWLFNFPSEAIIGALFLCMVMPSFVRYWAHALSASGTIDHTMSAKRPAGAA